MNNKKQAIKKDITNKVSDLKAITKEAEPIDVAKDMAKSISKMYEDRDKKAVGAKGHLIAQLEVTVDKYRTANGVMAALETVRDVFGQHHGRGLSEEIAVAKNAATGMSRITSSLVTKAKELDPEDMGSLCSELYDPDFAGKDTTPDDMVLELMVLELCQKVGSICDDIVGFVTAADKEIDKAREDLKAYCGEHGLDFEELCGPHDNCPTCICMECANDCKEGRTIEDGQFAIEGCERFVRAEG